MGTKGVAAACIVAALVFGAIGMNVAADEEPSVESTHYEGYLACSVTVVVGFAACATTADTPVDTFDAFVFEFEVAAGLEELVVGVRWDPAGPVGSNLSVHLENEDCTGAGCSFEYADVDAGSPIVVRVTDDDIEDPLWTWSNINGTRDLQVRVFAGGDVALLVDQEFDVFVHEFYHQRAPADFDPFA